MSTRFQLLPSDSRIRLDADARTKGDTSFAIAFNRTLGNFRLQTRRALTTSLVSNAKSSNSSFESLRFSATAALTLSEVMYAMVVPTGGGANWAAEWTVFVDLNSDGKYDSSDLTVFQQAAPPPYITSSGNGTTAENPSYARYDGSGFFRPIGSLAPATLSISRSDAGSDYTQIRRVKIAMTGRVKVCTPQSAGDVNCAATGD